MPSSGALTGQHILLVAEYYPSGGTRTYVRQLLDFYFRHGARVTLVTTLVDPDPELQAQIDSLGFARITYAEVLGWTDQQRGNRRPTVWSPKEWEHERRAFQRLARDLGADRVVVSAGTPGMLLGATGATREPIHVLHTYPHGRRQQLLARIYLSRLIPRGTRFVAVSNFERLIMERLWRLAARDCTVDTILSSYGPSRPNTSQDAGPWMVLTVALVEEYKRPFDWVEVATRVIDRFPPGAVTFTWLGDGSLYESAKHMAAIRDPKWILFPGSTPDPSPQNEGARVYLQLSSIENMSLAVIDAQRHGLPCVVTNVGGLPEIIDDGVNGIIAPVGDIEMAVDAICRLLDDADLWNEQASGARRLYSQRHSLEAWEEAMLRVHARCDES